jgi:hypothetical protein
MGMNPNRNTVWTPEQDDLLRKLHADGLSMSQIAAEMGLRLKTNYSRNAVIGRATRQGLPKRNMVKTNPKSVFPISRTIAEGGQRPPRPRSPAGSSPATAR